MVDDRHPRRERDRADRRSRPCAARASRSSSRSASSRPTAPSPPRSRSATRSTRCRRRTFPTPPRTRQDMAAFKASARSLDQGIGAVLNALHTLDLRRAHADHLHHRPRARLPRRQGDALRPRHRRDADHARPRGFTGGKVIDALVSHLDVYPTICELAGIEPPAWLEGTSLMPLVRGERAQIHDEIFTEMTYHAAYQPQRAIRTERWKYIRRFERRPAAGARQLRRLGQQGPAGRARVGARAAATAEELYDLVLRPERGPQRGRRSGERGRCSASFGGGSRRGWSSAATRCSTGRSRRRPGPRSTIRPDLAGRADPPGRRQSGSHGRAIQVTQSHSPGLG